MNDWQDPNAALEAANYDNPIPSRVLILQTLANKGEATQHELANHFDLDDVQYEALGNPSKLWCVTGSSAATLMVVIRLFIAH